MNQAPVKQQSSKDAAALLALGLLTHYAWALAPDHFALWWNIFGSIARLSLLTALLWHRRGWVIVVGAWWACEELLVIFGDLLYIIRPWPVEKGQAIVSSLLHYDLGTVGLLVVALTAWRLARKRDRE